MNIFLREMKAHRKSLFFWCIGMVFMVAAGMGKYSGLSAAGQSINDIVSKMPKSVQSIMGLGSFDLTKASGYYGMLFLFLALIAAVHASMLGADIISKEERDRTSEFLFVKPVSRDDVITAKLSAAFINILILNIITLISSIVIVGKYSKGEALSGDIIKLMIGMFILQLIFLFTGTGTAAASKNPKTAFAAATGILLATFVLYKAIDLNSKLEGLKYLTPFKYFDAKNLLSGTGFEPVFVVLSVVIVAALFSATYVFYKKRDLNV